MGGVFILIRDLHIISSGVKTTGQMGGKPVCVYVAIVKGREQTQDCETLRMIVPFLRLPFVRGSVDVYYLKDDPSAFAVDSVVERLFMPTISVAAMVLCLLGSWQAWTKMKVLRQAL